ncbi:MAG: ATP-binding protein [Eubacteriales bacterium]|nr:ATP-binding protein [Eubacteriales bacterium]
MSMNNSQYDSIQREYQLRQLHHRHELETRRDEVYLKIPMVEQLQQEIASLSVQCGRRLLQGDESALSELKEDIFRLSTRRTALLTQAGYPADYLEMTYDCPDCKDTGYIQNQKCHCFKKAEIDLLYQQSNLSEILKKENFDAFRSDYYSAALKDPKSGLTARENAKEAFDICRSFADHFDTGFENLLLYGDPGVGKTFLSHCIARELIEHLHSVIYLSAQELFDHFAKERFERKDAANDFTDHIYDCDLLIIDDLGTELTNTLVVSELFTCINVRLRSEKAVIISTNLSPERLRDLYSERISSRILSEYTLVKLFGRDIRMQKTLENRM